MARSVAGSRNFTTVLSRKATIDAMIATAITLLVGATSRSFIYEPADDKGEQLRAEAQRNRLHRRNLGRRAASTPSAAGGSSGANRKGGAVSALPAAAPAATTAAAAPAATTAAAAAAAEDDLHGAGLSHDRQFIAESATDAINLKMNNHPTIV
jgi:hypothetical protein